MSTHSPDAAELAKMSKTDVLRASPRMFENDLLDKVSRVHWAVVPIIYVPVIVYLFAYAVSRLDTLPFIGYLVGGYVFWTLTEYWLHRMVFHWEPDNKIGARLHWIIHGVHHDHPNDPLRLVMPPSASIPLVILFLLGFSAALGDPAWYAWGASFLAGYLAYDMLHYFVHHHRPKSRLGKMLRENHMRHHFQDHDARYGVSAPFWDRVFGTSPAQRPDGAATGAE